MCQRNATFGGETFAQDLNSACTALRAHGTEEALGVFHMNSVMDAKFMMRKQKKSFGAEEQEAAEILGVFSLIF